MAKKIQEFSAAKRRMRKIRCKISRLGKVRLSVYKTAKNIYAQIFTSDGGKVIASASSVEKEIKSQDFGKGKIKIAEAIGGLVAKRAMEKGVVDVAFDRGRYKYHGRVKALADGARNAGLEF